jgi:chromosome partitioning protein
MRTIAFAGRKGGTGKTTTAVNVAGWLAGEAQRRVLLVDFDPQGNASTALDIQTDGADIWRLLVRQDPLPELVKETRPGLHLLAGGEQTATARDVLAVQSTRDARAAMYALRDILVQVAGYDYILIDCPPSLDLLAVNAVLAAGELALPVPCQFLGAEGARQFVDLAAELTDTAGGRAELAWVIPTFFRPNVNLSQEILDALREAFGDRVTDPVRLTVRLDEAAQRGQTIFEYEPRGNGAVDYTAVAKRIDYGR